MRGVKTETNSPIESVASEIVVASPPLWRLQLVRALLVIGIVLGFVGGADWLNLIALLPPEVSKWLAVSGPAFAAAIRPAIEFIGDWVDDGEINKSFRISALLLPMALLITLSLASCAAITSGVTGQPIATAPVQREGGCPFNVATSDIARAEARPETAWGLYNAGAVAEVLTPIADSGK